jgi:hypothetical protein
MILAEAFRINPNPDNAISARLGLWLWHNTYSNYFASISGYRLQTLLEGVRTLARGGKLEWPGKKEPVPDFELPKRFDARAARVKATAWLLARNNPCSESGSPVGALEQLSSRGPAAMVPIVPFEHETPGMRSIANRTFASDTQDLRSALLSQAGTIDPKLLWTHAISPDAAHALMEHNYQRFLQIRKASIEWLEKQYFESLLKSVIG